LKWNQKEHTFFVEKTISYPHRTWWILQKKGCAGGAGYSAERRESLLQKEEKYHEGPKPVFAFINVNA
jgi:hypothetical protein